MEQKKSKHRLKEAIGDHHVLDDGSQWHSSDKFKEPDHVNQSEFHKQIEPTNVTPDDKKIIKDYCSVESRKAPGSSSNINGYLRRCAGSRNSMVAFHAPDKVKTTVKQLSNVFKPENRNKKNIVTLGAVPNHIGEGFINDHKNDKTHHHLAGFTSTTSKRSIALNFARDYNEDPDSDSNSRERHIVRYHVLGSKEKPGMGVSLLNHSPIRDENEVLLHHGAHIEYHGHEVFDDPNGEKVFLHHVTVHPEHKQLNEYGEYGDDRAEAKKLLSNPKTDGKTLNTLAMHHDPEIRKSAYSHQNMDVFDVGDGLSDPDPSVRAHVEKILKTYSDF
jgi:hypothetical protein